MVIPEKLRQHTLNLIHRDHIGVVRMKAVARTYVWWPNIDMDIETYVKVCEVCGKAQSNKTPLLINWPDTKVPFERIHIDFCKIKEITILVVVDTMFKWLEARMVKHANANEVIEIMRTIFATFGLPKQLVSDNGPPFGSQAFIEFCNGNGIECLKSPPYNPQSNGSAERAVQTVKSALKKYLLDAKLKNKSWNFKINNLLFHYRSTPTTTTNCTPAELLFQYKPKTLLDLINPKMFKKKVTSENQEKRSKEKKIEKKNKSNQKTKSIEFKPKEFALYRNIFATDCKWELVKIIEKLSPIRYTIKIKGKNRVAHIDQLRKYFGKVQTISTEGRGKVVSGKRKHTVLREEGGKLEDEYIAEAFETH